MLQVQTYLRANSLSKLEQQYGIHHRIHSDGRVILDYDQIESDKKNPIVLSGEIDEVTLYFPEIKPKLMDIDAKIKQIKQEIDNVWFCYHDLQSQKQFALSVIDNTQYSAPLFSARKLGGHPFDYLTAEYILNHLNS